MHYLIKKRAINSWKIGRIINYGCYIVRTLCQAVPSECNEYSNNVLKSKDNKQDIFLPHKNLSSKYNIDDYIYMKRANIVRNIIFLLPLSIFYFLERCRKKLKIIKNAYIKCFFSNIVRS